MFSFFANMSETSTSLTSIFSKSLFFTNWLIELKPLLSIPLKTMSKKVLLTGIIAGLYTTLFISLKFLLLKNWLSILFKSIGW